MFIPVPPPTNTVFLQNPSPKLLQTLGKTTQDCVADEYGRKNCVWLDLPSLPDDIEIHYGFEETCLLEEKQQETIVQDAPSNTIPFEIPEVPKKHTKIKRGTWKKAAVK